MWFQAINPKGEGGQCHGARLQVWRTREQTLQESPATEPCQAHVGSLLGAPRLLAGTSMCDERWTWPSLEALVTGLFISSPNLPWHRSSFNLKTRLVALCLQHLPTEQHANACKTRGCRPLSRNLLETDNTEELSVQKSCEKGDCTCV